MKELFMNIGMEPACSVLPSRGVTTSGHIDNVKTKDTSFPLTKQVVKYPPGNKCWHDKNNLKRPNFRKNSKRKPHVIEESLRRLFHFVSNPFLYPEAAGLFYRKCKSVRRRRTEAIEGALTLTLAALYNGCNLSNMAYGLPNHSNQMVYHNYSNLRNATGLSEIRQKRMMAILQSYDLVAVETIVEKELICNDGFIKYRTECVRITLSEKAFTMLGLEEELLKDRKSALERHNDKLKKKQTYLNKLAIYKPRPIFTRQQRKATKYLKNATQAITKKSPPRYPDQWYSHLLRDKDILAKIIEMFKQKKVTDTFDALANLGYYPPS